MRKLILLSIILISVIRIAGPVDAEEASLTDIVVTNTRDHLLVYFTVKDCFTPEMKEAIQSGIDTTFTFYIYLYERRDLWWDREVVDMEIKHSIKYDTLKETYEIRLSEQGDKPITVQDFEEAKKLMSEVDALKVAPLNHIQKGNRYRIQMMAELDKIRLPLYLHYVLFFLSLWDFQTDWYTIDFMY